MNEFLSGSGHFLFAVIGFIVLGIALAYGTMQWRAQREARRPGTIGHEPGPAPKELEGRDDRAAAR
jgi:hypothetical protein